MKQTIRKEIYFKTFKGNSVDIRFSDLPKDIQENDIIEIIREDSSYVSEINSYDAYTELMVIREVEETDEEYRERINRTKCIGEGIKKHKYEIYLKLKAEFEPNDSI